MPRAVDGTAGSTFWNGLDPAWLNLTTVADATDRPATQVDPDSLTYPDDQETAELPSAVFSEVEQLILAGDTLQNLLTADVSVAADVRDEALTGASYHYRTDPDAAADRLARSRRWIDRQLRKVGIEGPPAVTLSSADGSFAVTVTNHLDRSVTVQHRGRQRRRRGRGRGRRPDGARCRQPHHDRARGALTRATGVHNVILSLTDEEGTQLGSSVEVPIRSGQVSEVIWVILGAGCGILFVAIVLRLVRRIRGRNRGPTDAADADADGAA